MTDFDIWDLSGNSSPFLGLTNTASADTFDPFQGNTMAPVSAATPADAASAIAAGANATGYDNPFAGNTMGQPAGSGGQGSWTSSGGWKPDMTWGAAAKGVAANLQKAAEGMGKQQQNEAPKAQQLDTRTPQVSSSASRGSSSGFDALMQIINAQRNNPWGLSSGGSSSRGLLG